MTQRQPSVQVSFLSIRKALHLYSDYYLTVLITYNAAAHSPSCLIINISSLLQQSISWPRPSLGALAHSHLHNLRLLNVNLRLHLSSFMGDVPAYWSEWICKVNNLVYWYLSYFSLLSLMTSLALLAHFQWRLQRERPNKRWRQHNPSLHGLAETWDCEHQTPR